MIWWLCFLTWGNGGLHCHLLLLMLLPSLMAIPRQTSAEWAYDEREYVSAFINLTYIDPVSGKLHTEKSEVGKYGDGKIGPAHGVVVHVKSKGTNGANSINHYGCEAPFLNQIPDEPWIALIKRGQCNFGQKIENAYKSNASAVVIYNNRESSTLEAMEFRYISVNISAVFTYKWKGEEIADLVDNGSRLLMYITIGNQCSKPYSSINREYFPYFCDPQLAATNCVILTSVLFVSISFIVLMIISLAWLVFYYIQRFRYIHAKDRLARRLCNAAKKALSKIPTKHIKSDDKEVQGEGECCAVCIEPYKISDVIRILPCRHEFHKSCVDPWLLEHRTCPMCKMDILKYYGYVFTGSQESILHIDMDEGASEPDSSGRLPRRSPRRLPQPSDASVPSSPLRDINELVYAAAVNPGSSEQTDTVALPSSSSTGAQSSTPICIQQSLNQEAPALQSSNSHSRKCSTVSVEMGQADLATFNTTSSLPNPVETPSLLTNTNEPSHHRRGSSIVDTHSLQHSSLASNV